MIESKQQSMIFELFIEKDHFPGVLPGESLHRETVKFDDQGTKEKLRLLEYMLQCSGHYKLILNPGDFGNSTGILYIGLAEPANFTTKSKTVLIENQLFYSTLHEEYKFQVFEANCYFYHETKSLWMTDGCLVKKVSKL